MKKYISLIFIFSITITFYAKEYGESIKKFIRGDISSKTQAAREAKSFEIPELSIKAIDFALENYEILGNDRDLSALAVSGIISLPADFVNALPDNEKKELSENLKKIFDSFSDENVKVAILNKIPNISIPTDNFTSLLNDWVKNANPESDSSPLISSSITALGYVGNSESFDILFKAVSNEKWSNFSSELQNSIGLLSSHSENQLFEMIRSGNVKECRNLFDFVTKNQKNSQVLRAETAENTLLRTIYIYENSSRISDDLIQLQLDSFDLLKELKWTRASKTVMKYIKIAEKEFEEKQLSEKAFTQIIPALSQIAPMDCVADLSSYLNELNKKMETNKESVSEPVVLAIIQTLGAVGDKNAFDSLLAVTYYSYSDTVIAAARSSLARLKW